MTVSGNKFFVHVAGKTNNAHQKMVKNLRDIGKDQVFSFEESDFLVVFCPVVSRVGTDINAALKGIQGGKPILLVVMHHHYDPERIIAPSRRQVKDPNVRLTVDCLFHEGSLLDCHLNRGAWDEVQKVLGSSRSAVSYWKRFFCKKLFSKGGFGLVAVGLAMLWWCQWNGWSWWSWWAQGLDGLDVAVAAGRGGVVVGPGRGGVVVGPGEGGITVGVVAGGGDGAAGVAGGGNGEMDEV